LEEVEHKTAEAKVETIEVVLVEILLWVL